MSQLGEGANLGPRVGAQHNVEPYIGSITLRAPALHLRIHISHHANLLAPLLVYDQSGSIGIKMARLGNLLL